MNYNPNAGPRNPRKMQRVSDLNAVGPAAPTSAAAYMPPSSGPTIFDPMMSSNSGGINMGGSSSYATMPQAAVGFSSSGNLPMQGQNYGYTSAAPSAQTQPFPSTTTAPSNAYNSGSMHPGPSGIPGQFGNNMPPNFAMFQQPIVQDMAMQYGQRLADQGKQLMENQFEKYVPVAKLKYYFAVDNKYVINKLRLLFFPFLHKDWSLKYDQENPVQPRYDINAPDLYIPTMAYITYVVVAGLMLGMQNRFTPEQLGIQASSALAYSIFELVVYSITLYVVNIKTNLKTLDLLAFSGYKFVIIVACLLISVFFNGFGYYATLVYTSFSLGLFLLRTLKTKVLHDSTPAAAGGVINYDPYGNPQQLDYSGGRKRKLYFLFLIVGGQAFLSFLLSKHLYLPDVATLNAKNLKF